MATDLPASYWSATAGVGREALLYGANNSSSASYWSATSDTGRKSAERPNNTTVSASYWSSVANIGDNEKRSLQQTAIAATFYNRRGIPAVANRGDAGSAYRTQQTIADIEKELTPSPLSIKLAFGNDRALNNQSEFFDRLRKGLENLKGKISGVSQLTDFNVYKANSSNPDVAQAEPSTRAVADTHTITVSRLAQSHKIVSDQVANINSALGISGSFSVNGYAITVATTDTLFDIRDAINYGEDQNRNKVLDTYSEDINSNGSLDVFYTPAVYVGGRYLPSFSYSEDRDKDGILDASEDANGNGAIDGGSESIGATAYIEGDRLYIKSEQGGDANLSLKDSDNVLETLGYYKRDDEVKVLKTSHDNSLFTEPETSKFTFDGKEYTTVGNSVNSVLENVTIHLKGTSSNEVTLTIYKDATEAAGKVTSFVDGYNEVVKLVNKETLDKKKPVRDNVRIQDLVVNMAYNTSGKVNSIGAYPQSLSDLGLTPHDSFPKPMDVSALDNMDKRLNSEGDNGSSPFNKSEKGMALTGLSARIDRLGITSGNDLTLSVDRKQLNKTLTENPEGVYDVFNKIPDGVLSKLRVTVNDAIKTPSGSLVMQSHVVDHYKKNPNDTGRLVSSYYDSVRIGINTGNASSALNSLGKRVTGPSFTSVKV